jgi:hypothetical protein
MDDDRLYSLTVKTLYLVALLLNATVIWDQTRDTEAGQKMRATFSRFGSDVTSRVRAARDLRAAESWVVWEAMTILNEGEATDAD